MPSSTDPEPLVRLIDVSVDIDGHAALRGATLDVRPGRLLTVVGANGSGKSTLLSVIAGLQAPSSGRVERRADARIAFVPQTKTDGARLPLTVTDLVSMGRWRDRGPFRPLRRADRIRVAEAVDAVGLTAHAARPIGALSGGQRQRAFLGQALAQDADLLLLDEPMTGVDDDARRAAARAIATVAAHGAGVIVVTHDLAEISGADEVVTLVDGRVSERSSSAERAAGPSAAAWTVPGNASTVEG
ncbi:zinc ABC transporter ATP-binding protein AztA [Microbacterium sp. 179-B 1A2 NHS]|uniref:zinc ABC transporter ATP-binding protein AztA n=1 Tax=Microbacterium sp. 179-B 1A2 NHS TaxID=3142383 RepID=UPI0039A35AB9